VFRVGYRRFAVQTAEPGHEPVVDVASGGGRDFPRSGAGRLAGGQPQPDSAAPASQRGAVARTRAERGDRSPDKRGGGSAGHVPQRRRRVGPAASVEAADLAGRLLFLRVRPARIVANVCGRSGRAGRRSPEKRLGPRCSDCRNRAALYRGLFPPAAGRRRLAERRIRAGRQEPAADRAGVRTGRQAAHDRGTDRRSSAQNTGLEGAGGAERVVSAGQQRSGELQGGPPAYQSAVRGRLHDPNPAGDRAGNRGHPDAGGPAQDARHRSLQRGPLCVCAARMDPPAHGVGGGRIRQITRSRGATGDLHDTHADPGRARLLLAGSVPGAPGISAAGTGAQCPRPVRPGSNQPG